jgi:hypothetical protein
MDQTTGFISEFCRWAEEHGLSRNRRARLSAALRRAIEDELPQRDDQLEVLIRPLENSEGLYYLHESKAVWLYYCISNRLITGVASPGWRTGWKHISRDEIIADIIDSFFHLAGQYVHRSRMAGIIGALAATCGRACEFRYKGMQRYLVGADSPFGNIEAVRAGSEVHEQYRPAQIFTSARSARNREFSAWVRAINGLDPYIHRAVYQFWKATALLEMSLTTPSLSEEAIAALDHVASVAAQFARDKLLVSVNPRPVLATALGMPAKDQRQLDHLYMLRCDFGAHPSWSKWWDFGEIYEEDINSLYETVKRLLWYLCQVEKRYRTVEMLPPSWSAWFQQNSLVVWNAVW